MSERSEETGAHRGYPSGQQFEIALGPHRATLVEVGGGLRSYRVHGRDVLDGYPEGAMCSGARGTPLIPWPNRLADGAYTFDGTHYQVALTEPGKHNAIHGFLRWRNWTLRDQAPARIVLGTVLHPLRGYPFALDIAIEYALDQLGPEDGGGTELTVSTTSRNIGGATCPYGAGQHPYLAPGSTFVDEATLTLDAATWLPTDERGLPTGRESVTGSPYDFRAARRIGAQHVDNAFTDLARDPQGRAWVHLDGPEGWSTGLWVDEHYPFIEIYTGDTQPPEQRRRGLGVEPMTCAPNGFRSGDGLLRLEPGQSARTRWGLRHTPPPTAERR